MGALDKNDLIARLNSMRHHYLRPRRLFLKFLVWAASYRPHCRAGHSFRTFHMFVDQLYLQLIHDYRTAVRREAQAQQSDLRNVWDHTNLNIPPAATGNKLCVVCCANYNKYLKKHPAMEYGIADLDLSWLEYQYLSKLVTNKDFNLLHKLKYNSRYINDIITPNVENFLEIAKHTYPPEIPLEQTHNDSLHDTFLDLDITVVNRRFCFKVFHKVDLFDFEVISFLFLESNIPQYICYNTFFLSWLDFLQFV